MSLFNANKSSDDHKPDDSEEGPVILDGDQLEFEQVKRGWNPDQVTAWAKAMLEQHQHDLDLASERIRHEQAIAKAKHDELSRSLEDAHQEAADALATADQVIAAGKNNGTVIIGEAADDQQQIALEEQVTELQQTIERAEQDHNEVVSQLNDALHEIKALQSDIDIGEQKRIDLQRQIDALQVDVDADDHDSVHEITAAADRRVAEAEGKAQALGEQLQSVQQEINSTKEALIAATGEGVYRDQELEVAKTQITELTQEISDLKQQVRTVIGQRDTFEERVRVAVAQRDTFEAQARSGASAAAEIQELTATIAKVQEERDTLASDVQRLTLENQDLPKLLRDSDRADRAETQLELLRQEASENIRNLAHAQARVDILNSEIERVRSEQGQWGESARHIARAMEDARAAQSRELEEERERAGKDIAALVAEARSEAEQIRMQALASGSDLDAARQQIIDSISKHRADHLQSAESRIRELQEMSRQNLESIRREEEALLDNLLRASTAELDRLTREKNLVADTIDEMRKTAETLTDTVSDLKQQITSTLHPVDPVPVLPASADSEPSASMLPADETPVAPVLGPVSVSGPQEPVLGPVVASVASSPQATVPPVSSAAISVAQQPAPVGETKRPAPTATAQPMAQVDGLPPAPPSDPEPISTAIPLPAVTVEPDNDPHTIFSDLDEPEAPSPVAAPTPAVEDPSTVDLFALDDEIDLPAPDLSGLPQPVSAPQPGVPLIFDEDD